MAGKDKETTDKVVVLKGTAAEKKVLDYINEMNRPFGAADIYANLKGAVAKTSVQKILVSLAEKGDITQKAYGKILLFVAKQTNTEEILPEEFEALDAEEKALNKRNLDQASLLKAYNQELNQLRNSPSNEELEIQLVEAEKSKSMLEIQLKPLRADQPLVTTEELSQLDTEWQKWRDEWTRRRKIFRLLYDLVTDTMTSPERQDMEEALGLEVDTLEHNALERELLCKTARF